MGKLLIVSGSMNVKKEPIEPTPALDRFNGVFTGQIKKHKEKLRGVDVLIISPVYGLIRAEDKIGYKEPVGSNWGSLRMSPEWLTRTRESNLARLQKLVGKRQYDEVYVNVGRDMLKLIEGFDNILPANVKKTYSEGNGIGPKMRHMRNWIQSCT